MKKKHLALGIGGALGAMVAWKLATRPRTVYFEDSLEILHHSDHSKFVEIDGVDVHYQEFGAEHDPVLLLVHGYTASTYVWHAVAPLLAEKGFRVIAIDLLGFGYSGKPKYFDYSIASQARMLQRFMNRLGIGKATIVGSSFGGAVTNWFALDNPERVEKLVLVGAVINDEPMESVLMRLVRQPGIGETLSPFLIDSRAFLKFRMQGTLHPTSHHLITEDRIDSVIHPLQAADAHHSLLTTARNWNAGRIERDAHLLTHPTLLIWGEEDTVIPLKNGEILYDKMLNSRLVVLKDCGHLPHEERADLFVELVSEFCGNSAGRLEERSEEGLEIKQVSQANKEPEPAS
ncbi:MAG: alpha/beta hydrolase [Pyrinomonadaceae bacterium]